MMPSVTFSPTIITQATRPLISATTRVSRNSMVCWVSLFVPSASSLK